MHARRGPSRSGDVVETKRRDLVFLGRLRADRPRTKLLLMSGYSREAVFQNEIVEVPTAFLPKPFSVSQLTTKVREVLDAPA
jgi:DNA-binding NtrC family response regulator